MPAPTDRDYQRHVTAEGRPKSLDSGGLTPLLYAARENCMACVDVLLENGADIDLPDPDGVSPLLVAIMNANWDLARQLIEAGADVNQWDIYGEAPLFTAVDLRTPDRRRPGVDRSAEQDRRAWTIVKLLLERGANPNMQLFFRPANVRGATNTRGSTPLIRAANNGDLEVVKLLLEHGADATLYMADRQTPIHAVLAGRASEQQALELITRPARRPARTSTSSRWSTTARRFAAARRCTTPCASATRRSSSCSPPSAST